MRNRSILYMYKQKKYIILLKLIYLIRIKIIFIIR